MLLLIKELYQKNIKFIQYGHKDIFYSIENKVSGDKNIDYPYLRLLPNTLLNNLQINLDKEKEINYLENICDEFKSIGKEMITKNNFPQQIISHCFEGNKFSLLKMNETNVISPFLIFLE